MRAQMNKEKSLMFTLNHLSGNAFFQLVAQ